MFYLKFSDLPTEIQERLLKRQRGEGEGFAVKTGSVNSSYVLIALALLWFAALYFLSNTYLWGNARIIVFGAVSLSAAYLLFHNLFNVFRWIKSPSKSYLLIMPLYVIDIDFDDIRYWELDQLLTASSLNKSEQVKLTLEHDSTTFSVKDSQTAEEMVEQINYWRKLFIEATVRNDTEYLDSNDLFGKVQGDRLENERKPRGNYLQYVFTGAAAAILAVGIMFGAIRANNYFDDKKSWDAAQAEGRASSYRNYLETHPNGRRAGDAGARLQTLYDEAEQKYIASLNTDYDPDAVDAVVQILRYARATQNYRVKVVFERRNEIPPDIVEKLREEYEVTKMISIGDTFSDDKMKQREDGLLVLIAEAFRQVIPHDILEITGECSDECAVFSVKYTINSDVTWYDLRQEKLPEKERTYYPGIYFDWAFDVRTPNQPKTYKFTLHSDPANEISYDGVSNEEYDPKKDFALVLIQDRDNIYNSMASSAFDDFKANLVFRMGLGPEPQRDVQTTPTPERGAAAKEEKLKSIK